MKFQVITRHFLDGEGYLVKEYIDCVKTIEDVHDYLIENKIFLISGCKSIFTDSNIELEKIQMDNGYKLSGDVFELKHISNVDDNNYLVIETKVLIIKCLCCDEVKGLTHCEDSGNDIGIVDN